MTKVPTRDIERIFRCIKLVIKDLDTDQWHEIVVEEQMLNELFACEKDTNTVGGFWWWRIELIEVSLPTFFFLSFISLSFRSFFLSGI